MFYGLFPWTTMYLNRYLSYNFFKNVLLQENNVKFVYRFVCTVSPY